jgi:hypothetical protein
MVEALYARLICHVSPSALRLLGEALAEANYYRLQVGASQLGQRLEKCSER